MSRRSGRIATIQSEQERIAESRRVKPPAKPESERPCIHPVNAWFKDPRQPAPQLPSRAATLRKLFLEHAHLGGVYAEVLDHYVSGDDRKLLAQEKKDQKKVLFPKFMLLPLEIRRYIWQLAVPQRVLDERGIQWPSYGDTPCPRLLVPHIARVCREAREVVLRMGTKVALFENFCGPDSDSAYDRKNHPAGFITTQDMLYYKWGFHPGTDGMIKEGNCDAEGVTLVPPETVLQELKATDVGVGWGNPNDQFFHRYPLAKNNEYYVKRLSQWKFLTKWTGLKRILVMTRSHVVDYNDVSLLVKKRIGGERYSQQLLHLFVDLYDDQTLAEIAHVETAGTDDTTPRYIAYTQRRAWGPCLNCEREIWERDHKAAVEHFWLRLHADDLTDQEQHEVFVPDQPYNPDHPWVREILSRAPEFRPAIAIRVYPCTAEQLREDESSEEEEEEEEEDGDDDDDEDYA